MTSLLPSLFTDCRRYQLTMKENSINAKPMFIEVFISMHICKVRKTSYKLYERKKRERERERERERQRERERDREREKAAK